MMDSSSQELNAQNPFLSYIAFVSITVTVKETKTGPAGVAQLFTAPAAPAEDQGSTLSTHMVFHDHL